MLRYAILSLGLCFAGLPAIAETATPSSPAATLEFRILPDRLLSVTNPKAVLTAAAMRETTDLAKQRRNVAAALPGYDVRLYTAAQQEKAHDCRGIEGVCEDRIIVSRRGRKLLEIDGNAVDAFDGVVDPDGVTVGMPLNKAFQSRAGQCTDSEITFCWMKRTDGATGPIAYVVDDRDCPLPNDVPPPRSDGYDVRKAEIFGCGKVLFITVLIGADSRH